MRGLERLRKGTVCSAMLLLATQTGCDSPTLVGAAEVYAYWIPDGRVMRWPQGSVIRVYASKSMVSGREPLIEAALDSAITLWNGAARYGEFVLQRTERLDDAAVVVGWSDEPPPVTLRGCIEPPEDDSGWDGMTHFCDIDRERLKPFEHSEGTPSEVRFVVHLAARLQGSPERVPVILSHEIGHTLGIWAHSPRDSDLMGAMGAPKRLMLSARDVATLQLLYHTRPDVLP